MYNYGQEIIYDFSLLQVEDFCNLQPFECLNEVLDNHIRYHVIKDNIINNEDGLYFKFTDISNNNIIAITSLASSGIIFNVGKYSHVLPAIKIDVLAVDKKYQKLHFDKESKYSFDCNQHYYFSDEILGTIINHCRYISKNYILANYIVLYADKLAYRYYIRNRFLDYSEYMIQEENQEISKNIPMYFDLNV